MTSEGEEIVGMLIDSADAFLAERHDRARLRIGAVPPETAVDPAVWQQMAALGWMGLGLPEEIGGAGLDLPCSAALCERLGTALLPEPFIASALLPGALLAACSPGSERDRLAQSLVTGDATLTLAWQEAAGQIGFDGIAATVEGGALRGTKLFVPMSLPNMTCLVVALDAGEPVVIVLGPEAIGVTATVSRMGDGSRMARLEFDGAPVGPVLARGAAAVTALDRALGSASVALSAQLAGLADGALALSLDYLRTRVQFGQPIGAFQALQHRAVDLYLKVELAKATWRRAARLQHDAPGQPATVAAVSAAKAVAIRAARDTAAAGVQFFGAMGFTEEADIGLFLRTALHWSSWLGNENAHRRRFYAHALIGKAA